jgi:hypothetical protein
MTNKQGQSTGGGPEEVGRRLTVSEVINPSRKKVECSMHGMDDKWKQFYSENVNGKTTLHTCALMKGKY